MRLTHDPRTPSFGAVLASKRSTAFSWQFSAAKAALVHGFLLSQFPKRLGLTIVTISWTLIGNAS